MTYPALKLTDGQILDCLCAARKEGVTTMVHCEVRYSALRSDAELIAFPSEL